MTRNLAAGFASALQSSAIQPIILVELKFDSGAVRLSSGIGNITYNGFSYTGAGTLLAISSMEDTTDIAAKGITISLSGINPQALGIALSEKYQNRTANIYFSLSGMVSDAVQVFSGLIDQMSINDTGETLTIAVSIESRLIDLERPRIWRYTSEDQKRVYPTDKGFDFVNDLQTKQIIWGRE